jgi:hypothetical protein
MKKSTTTAAGQAMPTTIAAINSSMSMVTYLILRQAVGHGGRCVLDCKTLDSPQ